MRNVGATSAPGPIAVCREHQSRWFRLLSVTWPALIPYSQDSHNIEFTNLIVYSSSAERLCFENANCASNVLGLCAALRLGNLRATCGSLVRRSCFVFFLIDRDLAQTRKKYYREYYPSRAL